VVNIKPFRALRPDPKLAREISCVPYDVISESEAADEIRRNPKSFLRITRAEGECAAGEDAILRGKENLETFLREGILAQDEDEAIFIYRLIKDGRSQSGIIACCAIDDYDQGKIKKHEKTRPEKVEDRMKHMIGLRAQTGLIFLAYRATEKLASLIAEAQKIEPIYDFVCPAKVQHTIWKISQSREFVSAFQELSSLYVADGHHRAEAASRARALLRDANPKHMGDEDYNFVFAGIFPDDELKILPYNRVVKDLNGITEVEFFERAAESFVITPTENASPENPNEFCVYLSGKWFKLRFNLQFFRAPDPIDALDVTILQTYILQPILGINDVRTDKRIDFVGGIRGTKELERLVDSGEFKIAFSMFPTSLEEMLIISDRGEVMPPKSTWFEPKLRDGLLVHLI